MLDTAGRQVDTPGPGCIATPSLTRSIEAALMQYRNPASSAKSGALLGFLPFQDICPGLFPLLSHVDTVCLTRGPFGHPGNTC